MKNKNSSQPQVDPLRLPDTISDFNDYHYDNCMLFSFYIYLFFKESNINSSFRAPDNFNDL